MFDWYRETLARFSQRESVDPQPALPRSFLPAVFCHQVSCVSAVVEDEDAAVVEGNFDGLPGRSLVVALGLGAGGVSFLIEPVEVRVFVRDPLFDGLPRWLDGLHGIDVEGRWWRAWKLDDTFPQAVELEKELDLLAADDGADRFHGALAARTLEGITAPNFENEVAPEGANGRLLFQSARDAVSHARWAAKANGGTITVYDAKGELFKIIEIEPNLGSDDHFVLPNSDWPT